MVCEVCGRSNDECRIRKIRGMNLCPKHVTQLYRNGCFSDKTIYDQNDYVIYEDYAEIILRNKSAEEVGRAIIDLDDVERCKQYKWHIRKSRNTLYAVATTDEKTKIHLHRFIIGYNGDYDVDHEDRNGLNNRKENLRVLSHSDNLRNQSPTRKGIKRVPSGKYQVVITKNYVGKYLGTFDTYEEALEARLQAERSIACS